MSDSFYVLSGCSGGGKSTLLEALRAKGQRTVPEPGRIVAREQLAQGGDALPWINGAAFTRLVLDLAVRQYEAAPGSEPVFFDRSIVDAACGLLRHGLALPARHRDVLDTHRYATRVFMTPPWPEILRTDAERRATFADAAADYEVQVAEYGELGYEVVLVPKAPPAERADFVLAELR